MLPTMSMPYDDLDAERRRRVRREVADKVLADPDIFTTPVGRLSAIQVALLQASLEGPHADEIMAAMDATRLKETS